MSGQDNRNNHDLGNAGNVLGKVYNTNEYNPNYKEKKGMKFFVIMVIIVTVLSAIFLMIKPFPTLKLVQADEAGATFYLIDVNIFGKATVSGEKRYPYSSDNVNYLGLEGIYSQTAITANTKQADMIVANADIIDTLATNLTFENATSYLNIVKADTDRMLQNSNNGYYGLPVSTEFEEISFNEGEYLVFRPNHIALSDRQFDKIIKILTTIYD